MNCMAQLCFCSETLQVPLQQGYLEVNQKMMTNKEFVSILDFKAQALRRRKFPTSAAVLSCLPSLAKKPSSHFFTVRIATTPW